MHFIALDLFKSLKYKCVNKALFARWWICSIIWVQTQWSSPALICRLASETASWFHLAANALVCVWESFVWRFFLCLLAEFSYLLEQLEKQATCPVACCIQLHKATWKVLQVILQLQKSTELNSSRVSREDCSYLLTVACLKGTTYCVLKYWDESITCFLYSQTKTTSKVVSFPLILS